MKSSARGSATCFHAAALLIPFHFAYGQDLAESEIRTPVEDVRAAQDAEIDKIKFDLKIALTEGGPADARVQAISDLGGIGYDYLLANAAPLVHSADSTVAQAAVEALGSAIAMLPGDHTAHAGANDPLSQYQGHVVMTTEELIRAGLDHPDLSVRARAAEIMASRGDKQSLAAIQALIDKGQFSAKQGIGYLTLAPTQTASPFIEKYLSSPSVEAKTAAAAQLSYNSDYTDEVRKIALSPESGSGVLAAALPGLAQTDQSFLEYAVALTQDPRITDEVRAQAVQQVVRVTLGKGTDAAQVKVLVPALENSVKQLQVKSATDALQSLKVQYGIQ